MQNQNLVEKLYYDITFTNLASDQTISPIVNFIETRSLPFLYDPEQYYLSIIRFSLSTASLPIIIPVIQPDQPDVNKTIYSVSLSYKVLGTTVAVRTFLKFEPQNLIAEIPPSPIETPDKLQDNSTGYYYIYTYQFWIYLINKAFLECYNSLVFAIAEFGLTLPSPHAPVLEFDTIDRTAVINADRVGYDSSLVNPIIMYFNNNLGQLFSSFPLFINSDTGDPLGLNFKIAFSLFGGATLIQYPTIDPTYTAIQCWQEYSTTADWSPCQSIVFTSTLLPIVPNQLSNPVVLNNGSSINSNGNNANFAQIITDMMVENNDWKPAVLYNPLAQYRLVELVGNVPLYTIDIQIYWKDRRGQLIPFRLVPGGTATVKLLFTKKQKLVSNDY
jgi:hypothetical protein